MMHKLDVEVLTVCLLNNLAHSLRRELWMISITFFTNKRTNASRSPGYSDKSPGGVKNCTLHALSIYLLPINGDSVKK